jgi:hypothetical protein
MMAGVQYSGGYRPVRSRRDPGVANLTKAQRAEINARYTLMLDKISEAIVRSGRFIVEEGTTIAFGAMIWRVTGEVRQFDDDGNETPEWAIRTAIIDGMVNLRKMLLLEIPIIGIAPNSWLVPIIRAYEAILNKTDTQPNRYLAVPLADRITLVIMLPGLFRTMLQLMKGLLSK